MKKLMFVIGFFVPATLNAQPNQYIENNTFRSYMKHYTTDQIPEDLKLDNAFSQILFNYDHTKKFNRDDISKIALKYSKIKSDAQKQSKDKVNALCKKILKKQSDNQIIDPITLSHEITSIDDYEQQTREKEFKTLLKSLSKSGEMALSHLSNLNTNKIKHATIDYEHFAIGAPDQFLLSIVSSCGQKLTSKQIKQLMQQPEQTLDKKSSSLLMRGN